ncbi:hypothetical protein AB0N07_35230, partial [Streptomyces sp. NPDC051172]
LPAVPFVIHRRASTPTRAWTAPQPALTSRPWGLSLRGAQHATYTDAEAMIPQIARRLGLPRKTVVENIGTIAPRHAITAQRAYVAAFFDRWLRGQDDGGMLDGASGCHPEARYF